VRLCTHDAHDENDAATQAPHSMIVPIPYARPVPRTLVLANRGDSDPGLVGARLVEHGHQLTVATREEPEAWPDAHGFDLVVHLGSQWSVYADEVRTPVGREGELARRAVDAGIPVLGICFGAQLLALALGGSVARGSRTELGWLEIEPCDDTLEPGPWFQWHGDVFEPPRDARMLAVSDAGCQAFALGPALAVQFHPEVTPGIVGRWAASDPAPLERAGLDAAAIVARTASEQARVRVATARLVDGFLYGAVATEETR